MIGPFPGRWGCGHFAPLLLAASLSFTASSLQARIDLVTLPGRDATMITVYNSEDLTLVRETRTLSFSEGRNQIQFSWADTLIDPTSLRLEFPGAPDLTMVEAVYPAGTRDLVVWNIDAEAATAATVEITYFISGLTWSARYHLLVNEEETAFNMQQYTTVGNNSGEDFENTTVRVVVGEVNLVEKIADLARRGILPRETVTRMMRAETLDAGVAFEDMLAGMAAPMAARELKEAREIIQQAVSEYKLYTVDGEVDILNGWGQRLPSRPISDIPFDLSYEIDTRILNGAPAKVYRLRNTTSHELGIDALPEGAWHVTAHDGRGGMRFEGATTHDYIPLGDEIELNLGPDGLLLFEQKRMRTSRHDFVFDSDNNVAGWLETHVYHLEVRNTRDREVPVKLTFNRSGDWSVSQASVTHELIDTNTVRWEIDAPAEDSTTIEVEIIQRMGTLQGSVPHPATPRTTRGTNR